MSVPERHKAARRLAFLLIDDFALMSYATVAEAFRAANHLSGQALYEWRHFSAGGQAALASSGLKVETGSVLRPQEPLDVLFVIAGGNPAAFNDRATLQRLREASARGVQIAGVSGGPYLLARAGLLDQRRCTIHWEHEAAFKEAFPNVLVERSLFTIDGNLLSCAGGTAGFDLALQIIARDHGSALAHQVGAWFIQPRPREGDRTQRGTLTERYRSTHPAVLAALAAIDDNLAEPLPRSALAAHAGVSLRQLERLFESELGSTIARHCRKARLGMARRLLRESALSRIEIAMACGFADASHFSRVFREEFGQAPGEVRAAITAEQNEVQDRST